VEETHSARVRDRSVRLFRYLEAVERLQTKPVRTLDTYAQSMPAGGVEWLADLPSQPEVRCIVGGGLPAGEDLLLQVERVHLPEMPEPDAAFASYLEMPDGPDERPALRASAGEELDGTVRRLFDQWLAQWSAWEVEVARLRPVKDLYRRLFGLCERLDQSPEELEVVVASGCLSWRPTGHPIVRRHLLVAPALLRFEAASGVITLEAQRGEPVRVELDMLDPGLRGVLADPEDQLCDGLTCVLDEEEVAGPLSRLAHSFTNDGVYDPDSAAPPSGPAPVVGFAPALIVRRRTNQRKLRMLAAIVTRLEDAAMPVPDGVASIVDPIDLDTQTRNSSRSDLERTDAYLPLPANRQQREIVWSVEHRRHTVVQGPPGTGKTHTIANVLAHLLATGRRVLVTAQTERALKEVRGKLPPDLRDLAIAVTGQGRDERAELPRAVQKMNEYVDGYEPEEARQRQDALERDVDGLRRRQAEIEARLFHSRVDAGTEVVIGAYRGTVAQIVRQLSEQAARYGWLEDDHVPPEPPITGADVGRLVELLRRADLTESQETLAQALPQLEALPTPEEFARLTMDANAAAEAAVALEPCRDHPCYQRVRELSEARRRYFAGELRTVADDVAWLGARTESWAADLHACLAAGKPAVWQERAGELGRLIALADDWRLQVGQAAVTLPPTDAEDRLLGQARDLRDHLVAGGAVRRVLPGRAVRRAAELLQTVMVDGAAPATVERVDAVIAAIELERVLRSAEALWPAGTVIPSERATVERLGWLRAEASALDGMLRASQRLLCVKAELASARVQEPAWMSPSDIATLADVCREPDASARRDRCLEPFAELAKTLAAARPARLAARLTAVVEARDPSAYQQGWTELAGFHRLCDAQKERDLLGSRLASSLPRIAAALVETSHEAVWDSRASDFEAACTWACARQEVQGRLGGDQTDDLMAELDRITARLQERILQLTVARAWSHAASRLDPRMRRRLGVYATLHRKLPRGGKYRARKLRELQEALRGCRDAVPAWIMPISYVAEVLDVDPQAFDVVIVDEASQAGIDAAFLQYLAPKMVVIGDDLQVSPTSFVEHAQLHQLADKLLADFEDKALWADPEASLFDHAKGAFGKKITLVEHFRCMPEIIRYSQRYVYEPERVKLSPLRQYGADRLVPVRTHHVADGYRRGKVNPPEVEALVEIVAKCDVDPAYEYVDRDTDEHRKRTFGVISLIGAEQARAIEAALIERLGERAYAERGLRCGDASSFQGSQRDVMFLSMVEAPRTDGSRFHTQTTLKAKQRLNVAASRARDQMWLVHSVLPKQLSPDDLRRELLDHCLTTESQFGAQQHAIPAPVSETVPDDRFDSLFEQRVFNRLVERGYAVEEQVETHGYRIDLVVVGTDQRLAVECDGDHWHGLPDQHKRDVHRQRDLERAGWRFFRLGEAQFYTDPDATLAPLWDLLDAQGITPVPRVVRP